MKGNNEDNRMTSISVAAEECAAFGQRQQVVESFPGRDTNLGNLKILRALPIKGKRLVGPWRFLDRYGPYMFTEGKPMDVAPHPHIGLQTVTWLLDGEIVHHDSLGYEGLIRPGGVNVMTAGNGIGGPPFPESILMWWNFVARTPDEIAEARAALESDGSLEKLRPIRARD